MPNFKTIDIGVGVRESALTENVNAFATPGNLIRGSLVRGDQVLVRVNLFAGIDDPTAYALAAGDGLELIVTNRFAAGAVNYMAYVVGDNDTTNWASFSKAAGKVSFLIDLNTTNLDTDLDDAERKRYFMELVVSPAGSSCAQITALQCEINIRNSILDIDQAATVPIVINPPCLNSSSSQSSSSSNSRTTSSSSSSSNSRTTSSSSTVAGVTSSSSSSQSSSTEAETTSITSSSSPSSSSSSSSTSFG